jgi:hypothetical protein
MSSEKTTSRNGAEFAFVVVGPLIASVLVILQAKFQDAHHSFRISGLIDFGPNANPQTLSSTVSSFLLFCVSQLLFIDGTRTSKGIWTRLFYALLAIGAFVAVVEIVAGDGWIDELARAQVGYVAMFSPLSICLAVAFLFAPEQTRRFVSGALLRITELLIESRHVVPIFIVAFFLTIFDGDLTKLISKVSTSNLMSFVGVSIFLSAGLMRATENRLFERIIASSFVWFVCFITVFGVGVLLIPNSQLLEWGAQDWVSCVGGTPIQFDSDLCVEVFVVPRFKVAALLASLGAISILAQSLTPPVARREN